MSTLLNKIKIGAISGLTAFLLSNMGCSNEPWDPTGKSYHSSSSSSSSSSSDGTITIIIEGIYQKSCSESNSAGYSN